MKYPILLLCSLVLSSYSQAEDCGEIPNSAKSAIARALKFQDSCAAASASKKKPMLINDYSSSNAYMYLVSPEGLCEKKFKIGWGRGRGKIFAEPRGCNDNNSNYSPPGFHLTCPVNAEKFGLSDKNSLKLCGLSGQISAEPRGILIHAGGRGPASIGCTTLAAEDNKLVHQLGHGLLVYNSFGAPEETLKKKAPGCKNDVGFKEICIGQRGASSAGQNGISQIHLGND